MHGGVPPRQRSAPVQPGVEWCKWQLLDHDIMWHTGRAPEPLDSVPHLVVGHAGLAGDGQQLSGAGGPTSA